MYLGKRNFHLARPETSTSIVSKELTGLRCFDGENLLLGEKRELLLLLVAEVPE